MEDHRASSLAAQCDRLSAERARLSELVAAYRIVRASRFARLRDLMLAIKRVVWHVDEPPALDVLDLPPFHP